MKKRGKSSDPISITVVSDGPEWQSPERPRYAHAPRAAVAQLVNAARSDPALSRVVLALFDHVLRDAASATLGMNFHPGLLPEPLRPAAARLLRWSIRPDRTLNLPWHWRGVLAGERAQRLAGSAPGQRARKLVETAGAWLPRKQGRAEAPTNPFFDVLRQFNGQPVSREFLELLGGLRPASVSFVSEPDGKAYTGPAAMVVRLDHGCLVRRVDYYAPLRPSPQRGDVVFGPIEEFTEMGMEGTHTWILDGEDGRLQFITAGDQLSIYQDEFETAVLWSGVIDPDEVSQAVPRAGYGRQHYACGAWVAYTQRSVPVQTWAQWFFQRPHLRARLVKRDKHSGDQAGATPL